MVPPVRKGNAWTGILAMAIIIGSVPHILAQTSVLTQHNDISRTGQNLSETILTPATVSEGDFGKIFTLPTDGQVLAQPLYVPDLTIAGAAHNVVFVETENDTAYAFDADSGGTPLWQASMLTPAHGAAPGATVEPASDTGCEDLPQYGITGTPVIDPASGTIYLVSVSFENNYAVQRLHALSITTGAEKFGGPVVISASIAGTGTGSSGGLIKFDPKWENQRAGLLLANGTVYIAFGAHCDFGPFHGWLMAYNASTLAQTSVFLTTPNGEGSGLWMGGSGLAADVENGETRMFLATGNGTYDATTPYKTNTVDYGDDILRLNLSNGISVADAFTAKDQAARVASDTDLGSGGALILPDQPGPYPHLLVQTGKGNEIFLVNRENLGGYSTTANNVVQELDNQDTYLWGMPAYWNGNIYTWTAIDYLKQFSLSNGLLSQTPIATGLYQTTTGLGSTPSISANGTTGAILWVVDWSQYPQVLYAVDATNVANTFWSSATNPTRDSAGPNVKYSVPTIANGKVYVAGTASVMVYGILPIPNFAIGAISNSVSAEQGSTGTDTITVTDLDGFSGAVVLTGSGLPSGLTVAFTASSTGSSALATFTASSSAVPGRYAVTITGTSGTLKHSITLSLTVVGAPTFSLSAAPSSVAVQRGSTVAGTITVLAVYGFTGAPTFSVSGLPKGVTASFSPASSASATTLTLVASATAYVGTFPLTVTGTYGSIVKTAPLSLSVTFGLSLTNFQFVNKATGVCMDVNSISKQVGAQISQYYCWGGGNQLWNATKLSSGAYTFTSINSGLVIDVIGSSKSAGAYIDQDTYASLASQQWNLQKTSDGYFNLVNVNSGLCLDGVESVESTGDETQQNICSTAASQKWSMVTMSNTTTVNMASSFNVNAVAANGSAVLNGGIDGASDALPEGYVGAAYSFYGFPFVFGPANAADAVTSKTVPLPPGQYTLIVLLGLATNGPQLNQTFSVTYSDGTTASAPQSINDWLHANTLYSGLYSVITAPYYLNPKGVEVQTASNVFGFGLGLDSTRTAVSITLPNNANVKVLAITLGNE